jgi:carboxymethylenebutenolidase
MNPSKGSGKRYAYPKMADGNFALPFKPSFSYSSEAVSHTRNLTFLKPLIDGPYFDLEAIWEEHTYYEFADRSVAHTMSTMVQEPYVNHVPTMTGGVGRKKLKAFYRDHFIFNNSVDTEMEMISRTLGVDRVVDEFIFKFTHDMEIDWM